MFGLVFNGDSVIFWFDLFIVNYALGFSMCEGDISSTQRFEAIRFDLVWFLGFAANGQCDR